MAVNCMRNLVIAIICVAALTARGEEKTKTPRLFGVPLGISGKEFSLLYTEAGAQAVSFGGVATSDEDISLSSVTIDRTVNPVPGSASTRVTFANDRALDVCVALEDVSLKGWNRIRSSLVKKYGPSEQGTASEEDEDYYYRKKTQAVHIEAKYYGRMVKITYSDAKLQRQLDKLRAKRKRERLRRQGKNDSLGTIDNL